MKRQTADLRKKRTRQHVIADISAHDISAHYVEGFALEEGHTAQRLTSDYSYDLLLRTFDEEGYAEPGLVLIQLKSAESLHMVGSDYVFDVDIRDYHLWKIEEMPVLLILFDAAQRKAFWIAVQQYFSETISHQPKKGSKTVRVRVPKRQLINRKAIQKIRIMKLEMQQPKLGVRS
jgi:hypothetical protein